MTISSGSSLRAAFFDISNSVLISSQPKLVRKIVSYWVLTSCLQLISAFICAFHRLCLLVLNETSLTSVFITRPLYHTFPLHIPPVLTRYFVLTSPAMLYSFQNFGPSTHKVAARIRSIRQSNSHTVPLKSSIISPLLDTRHYSATIVVPKSTASKANPLGPETMFGCRPSPAAWPYIDVSCIYH